MKIADQWYKTWFDSPYYHLLYFQHDNVEAASFVERLIRHLAPPPASRMLDLGCGRGRYAVKLAALGFTVTGIDLSPNSIAEARKMENDHLEFYVHDMRLPFRSNYFDYTFNFFTSFGYFRTEREHAAAVRSIAQGLHMGGCFVLDYLNVHYAEDHLVHKMEKQVEGVTFYLTKWFDETHFYKRIRVEDERLAIPLEFTEKVAKFSLGDFNDMLAYQHLQIQEVFGNYQLDPYDINQSPRLILLAKKIKA